MSGSVNYSKPDEDVRILLSLVIDAVVDDTVVQYFIDRADNYIDSRLATRYNVPFTQATTPPILNDISSNLAAYSVLKRLKIETNDTEQDYARTFYNDAMKSLKEISSGIVEVLDSSGNIIQPLSRTGIVSSTKNYEPVFNEGNEIDWRINQKKVSDEKDSYRWIKK